MIKKIFLLLIVFSLISCGSEEKSEDSTPTVSVSILPQKYFVEQIAGDLFSINVMIPPGASPATYEPTPAQLTALTKTDLYMKMGYTGFEMSWMEKLISINKTMKVKTSDRENLRHLLIIRHLGKCFLSIFYFSNE